LGAKFVEKGPRMLTYGNGFCSKCKIITPTKDYFYFWEHGGAGQTQIVLCKEHRDELSELIIKFVRNEE
jgi:hypothetical protein